MAGKDIRAEEGPGSSVKYFDDKGKIWQFVGGTRTWRNQNPGNMVVGDYSRNNGMIGKAGGFAVFGHLFSLLVIINCKIYLWVNALTLKERQN